MNKASIGLVVVSSLLVLSSAATRTTNRLVSNETRAAGIRVDCRLVRGDELAQLLEFKREFGDRHSVFAIGFVFNDTTDIVASLRIKIAVDSNHYKGYREIALGVVRQGRPDGRPFLALMSAPLQDDNLDLSSLTPTAEVLEVRYK